MFCHSNNAFKTNMAVTLTGLMAKLTLCMVGLRMKQGETLNKLVDSLQPVDPFRTFKFHKHTVVHIL